MRLKVYGWQGWRYEANPESHNHGTREICAIASKAALCRLTESRPSDFFNLCETGNAEEVRAATERPGVILWRPMDDHKGPWIVVSVRAGDSPSE